MTVTRVGIVGSGIMGSGIAEVAAAAGFDGRAPRAAASETADAMVAGAGEVARQAGRAGQARPRRSATRSWPGSRATTDLGDLADCDLVIESVVEDLAVKKHLFTELDRICADATRSWPRTPRRCRWSSWPWRPARPEQVCGIHFFNPAPVMALVEVVAADHRVATRPSRRGTDVRRRRAARSRSR